MLRSNQLREIMTMLLPRAPTISPLTPINKKVTYLTFNLSLPVVDVPVLAPAPSKYPTQTTVMQDGKEVVYVYVQPTTAPAPAPRPEPKRETTLEVNPFYNPTVVPTLAPNENDIVVQQPTQLIVQPAQFIVNKVRNNSAFLWLNMFREQPPKSRKLSLQQLLIHQSLTRRSTLPRKKRSY